MIFNLSSVLKLFLIFICIHMKILNLYEHIIIENSVEACVKQFGHQLFGDELGGSEKNTGTENSYVRDINDFTDNMYGEETPPELIKGLKNLKGCIKQYPEVLIPEKTTVYRGTTIPLSYFIKNKIKINTLEPIPYIYKASGKVQSWTPNFDIASIFGNHDSINSFSEGFNLENYQNKETRQNLLNQVLNAKIRIAFVLSYVTNPKEFLFKSKYFKMLSKSTHEDEILRVENTPIQVMAKFNNHEDVFLTLNSLKLIKVINYAIQEQ
jgi:hypothetical protein